jgi:hypothetical protein
MYRASPSAAAKVTDSTAKQAMGVRRAEGKVRDNPEI